MAQKKWKQNNRNNWTVYYDFTKYYVLYFLLTLIPEIQYFLSNTVTVELDTVNKQMYMIW